MRAPELGERRIIEIVIGCLERMPGMYPPFGDDVSAVDIGNGLLAVLKADMLVASTDIPPQMTLRQAARKAVVMNVSDLAAKGVRPAAILASLGLPRDLTEEDVREIGMGLNEGAREYGAYVLGGDTNEAAELVIDCLAFGVCRRETFIPRSGARPGDVLAVTGLFGKTAAGLKILLEGLEAPREVAEALVNSVLVPKARVREGLAMAEAGGVTASIDSSDGLAWSLHELSRASGVGFLVERLPIAPEVEEFAEVHGLDPKELCLYGGEEYELVVTVKPESWEIVERAVEDAGGNLTRIGVATDEKLLRLRWMGETIPIEPRGWEHFRQTAGMAR